MIPRPQSQAQDWTRAGPSSSRPSHGPRIRTKAAWSSLSAVRAGQQTRRFCWVDDLIEGTLPVMGTTADVVDPVSIANPSAFTMLEVAEKVLTLAGSHSRLVRKRLPPVDQKQRWLAIEPAKSMLSREPRVGLEDGPKETIASFRRLLAEST